MRSLAIGLIVLVLMMAGAVAASAQQTDDREVKARRLFGVGQYAEALEIYGQLYAETAHPTYVRNIGRCYQNMGEPDKAISSFREYLRQAPNLTSDQRAQIEGYIKEMEELKLRRQAETAPRPAPKKPALTPAPAPKPVETAPPPRIAAAALPPPIAAAPPPPPPSIAVVTAARDAGPPASSSSAPASGRRVAGYVIAGASLVALGVGGFFGVRAIVKEHDSQGLCPNDPCAGTGLTLNQQARSAAHVADFTVGGGLVGAGVAAYLLLTSRAPETPSAVPSARRLRLAPEVGPRLAGLRLEAHW